MFGKANENHQFGTGLFVHDRIESVLKREEFICGWMSCRVPRIRLCNVIVLNVHAPTDEKSDYSKECLMWK